MKKIIISFLAALVSVIAFAEVDTTKVVKLDGVSVVSFYTNTNNLGGVVKPKDLVRVNMGQEPSHVFKSMPSIIALSDNGTEFGYGYYRIRGLDQTRINVMLDGCPWNEAEDFGAYFANSPDLMSSMHSIKVERGTSSTTNGIAASAGGIFLESVDLKKDTTSCVQILAGSYNTYKIGVAYNSGLLKNGWAYHIRATQSQTDGFRDYGFNNSQALTFKVGKYFNEKHSLDFLSMNGYHRNGQGWIGNTLSELEVNPHANGNLESETDNWFMSMNRLQYKGWLTDNVLLVSSAYLQAQTGAYRMDLDNYMTRVECCPWEPTNILYNYGLTHVMAGANSAVKAFLGKLTLTGGINAYYYQRRHFSADGGVNVSDEEIYDNKGIKADVSLFTTANYKITKRWSAMANIQYRHVGFHYIDKVNPSGTLYSFDKPWDFVNWGIGTEFFPIGGIKVYCRYAMTNREPTRSDMFGGSEWSLGEVVTTTPEIANDVEVGITTVFDHISFNANAYYMWFKNELVLNGEFGPNGLPCHENAEKSHRVGIEFTLDWEIIKNLHFETNGSYSNNVVTTATFGTNHHILSPAATFNQDIAYRSESWNAGINFNHRSKMFLDMANDYVLPASWTLNIYGGKRFNNIELGAKLNNITNKVNYCTGSVNGNGEILYFREIGINFLANMKIYF